MARPRRNSPDQMHIMRRREIVAELYLQRLSMREIVEKLPHLSPPIVNDETGQPYDLSTIKRDLATMRDEWKAAAAETADQARADLVAELRKVRKAAWGKRNLKVIISSIHRECSILGLDAPTKREITGADGGPIRAETTGKMSIDPALLAPDEKLALARLLRKAGGSGAGDQPGEDA